MYVQDFRHFIPNLLGHPVYFFVCLQLATKIMSPILGQTSPVILNGLIFNSLKKLRVWQTKEFIPIVDDIDVVFFFETETLRTKIFYWNVWAFSLAFHVPFALPFLGKFTTWKQR